VSPEALILDIFHAKPKYKGAWVSLLFEDISSLPLPFSLHTPLQGMKEKEKLAITETLTNRVFIEDKKTPMADPPW
jgi:hypothetical protein